jgi:hypothetical protein
VRCIAAHGSESRTMPPELEAYLGADQLGETHKVPKELRNKQSRAERSRPDKDMHARWSELERSNDQVCP